MAVATKEQVRILLLLEAGEIAGLVPLDVRVLHMFAYFANILAPVWDLEPLDGKLLKRETGPLYPALQKDLDRLVGLGLVLISRLGYAEDPEGHWHLQGSFRLNHELAAPVISSIRSFVDETEMRSFVVELGLALSCLPHDRLQAASDQDATYADTMTSVGSVIDFAEWQHANFTSNSARRFGAVMPGGIHATRAELLHLYLRHLRSRLTS